MREVRVCVCAWCVCACVYVYVWTCAWWSSPTWKWSRCVRILSVSGESVCVCVYLCLYVCMADITCIKVNPGYPSSFQTHSVTTKLTTMPHMPAAQSKHSQTQKSAQKSLYTVHRVHSWLLRNSVRPAVARSSEPSCSHIKQNTSARLASANNRTCSITSNIRGNKYTRKVRVT